LGFSPRLFRIAEHKSCSICRSLERGERRSPEVAGFLSRVSTHVATRLVGFSLPCLSIYT
jgi:hypothetical protein